jgi:hypothetical protein
MKPLMFWRKSRGMLRWVQSWMKWAPLREEEEKRIPLFARIPMGWLEMRAKPM